MNCKFAGKNKFGRVVCMIEGAEKSPLPCPYQRYCAKEMVWENTPTASNCKKRKKHNG